MVNKMRRWKHYAANGHGNFRISSLKPLGWLKTFLRATSLSQGNKICADGFDNLTRMAAVPIYDRILLKLIFSWSWSLLPWNVISEALAILFKRWFCINFELIYNTMNYDTLCIYKRIRLNNGGAPTAQYLSAAVLI